MKVKENYRYDKIYDLLLEIYLLTERPSEVITLLNEYVRELDYNKKEIADWMKKNYPQFAQQPDFLHWEKTE
ncbi:MAG: hypothetical protein AAF573_07285 [Bacteroidota bacterium]